MLNRDQVIAALSTVGLPRGRRHIYEVAGPAGHFHIDYATYPDGSTGEVSRTIIDELEREGIIERAYPDMPHVNSWVRAERGQKETK
jgi:hypothetical protein